VEEKIVGNKGTEAGTVEVAVDDTREEVDISLPSEPAGEESSSSIGAAEDKVERVDIVFVLSMAFDA
jgi:hypothetical protein